MITYDPSVMENLASSLYKRAASIERTGAILGGLVGLAGTWATVTSMGVGDNLLVMAFGTLLGGAIGYNSARSRAFMLRAEAQKLLCQVQIEANTRRAAGLQHTA